MMRACVKYCYLFMLDKVDGVGIEWQEELG